MIKIMNEGFMRYNKQGCSKNKNKNSVHLNISANLIKIPEHNARRFTDKLNKVSFVILVRHRIPSKGCPPLINDFYLF